eukprot:CAMPEP_0184671864 /NCGR_PEP_ID=MMETSP0308-20130426/85755_1 /TAXON_ID=38269 /ORGANISM="Gloeochaete witrockiana, Strain SAG 46.84" /LENGTH=119 /DNA_ID=CAMNT_0027119077 /DNA_START=445 /DNA_END=805 /DNA_ORIENTATION=+
MSISQKFRFVRFEDVDACSPVDLSEVPPKEAGTACRDHLNDKGLLTDDRQTSPSIHPSISLMALASPRSFVLLEDVDACSLSDLSLNLLERRESNNVLAGFNEEGLIAIEGVGSVANKA